MIPEYGLAVLTTDLPNEARRKGDLGTVIDIYGAGEAYLIEFKASKDRQVQVVAVTSEQVIADKATRRIAQTYKKLSDIGLTRSFLNNFVIPRTYVESATKNEAGADRLTNYLSRQFSITADSLRDTGVPISFQSSVLRNFDGSIAEEMEGAGSVIALALARAAVTAYDANEPLPVPDADALRQELLGSGTSYVSFGSLLKYCWESGIPVLHVYNLPTNAQKSRGTVIDVDGRTVIVLCFRYKSPAKYLLPLAHELGHLANQHFAQQQSITSMEHKVLFNDDTEFEARRYATKLITGGHTQKLDLSGLNSAQEIAELAEQLGRRWGIDPGYLLNYELGAGSSDGALIGAALNIVYGGENAIELMRHYMRAYLDWKSMPREARYIINTLALDISPR